jgi:predicted nucleic acid-binding protein
LATIAAAAKARGPLVMDAHLATLALERGAWVATTDRDFARFGGLTVIDPLGDNVSSRADGKPQTDSNRS